jgi:hypothetical protein
MRHPAIAIVGQSPEVPREFMGARGNTVCIYIPNRKQRLALFHLFSFSGLKRVIGRRFTHDFDGWRIQPSIHQQIGVMLRRRAKALPITPACHRQSEVKATLPDKEQPESVGHETYCLPSSQRPLALTT